MNNEPRNTHEIFEELTKANQAVKFENLPLLHTDRPQLGKEFQLAQDKLFELTLEYVAATQAFSQTNLSREAAERSRDP